MSSCSATDDGLGENWELFIGPDFMGAMGLSCGRVGQEIGSFLGGEQVSPRPLGKTATARRKLSSPESEGFGSFAPYTYVIGPRGYIVGIAKSSPRPRDALPAG